MKHGSIKALQLAFIVVALAFPGLHLPAQTTENPPAAPPGSGNHWGQMGSESAELLRQLDANRDGLISQSEWDQFFADHDQDRDRRLSPEEIQSTFSQGDEEMLGPDYGRLAAFERLDVDRNDEIGASEWPGKAADFQYLDADRSGSLNRAEFLAKTGRWWNQVFESLDFNGDKVIVRSEWLDSNASFDRLDRNKNGAIERREFYNPR